MAREAHRYDEPPPLEAAPQGAANPSGAFERRPLRRARIRPRVRLRRTGRSAGRGAVVPTVRYRDVPAAVQWLCRAFGMKAHRVVAGEDGAPCYAELNFSGSLLMIAPIEDTAFGRLMVQPDEIGGVETQVCYLYVEDAQAHCARAKAAGAVVILDPDDEANQGRGYSCRDPEGHVWNFGTYDPWHRRQESRGGTGTPRREQQGLAALLLLSLAAILTADAVPPAPSAKAATVLTEAQAREAVEPHRRDPDPSAEALRERLTQVESAARETAERLAAQARAQLAEALGARQKAEREAAAVRSQLEEVRTAKLAAERTAVEVRALLGAAEKDAKDARAQAALEHKQRLASEQAAAQARRRVAAFRTIRRRPRVWCYNPYLPNPASNRGARLAGFCRG